VVQMRNRIRLQFLLRPKPLEPYSEQAELFTPIPEIVDPGHFPSVRLV
jgi:hypothetical protein